jgi:hypothetical protein
LEKDFPGNLWVLLEKGGNYRKAIVRFSSERNMGVGKQQFFAGAFEE